MQEDAFSKCHPAVNFLFFLGAIGFTAVIRHPAYLLVSCGAAMAYFLALEGTRGLKRVGAVLPLLLLVALVNPLMNTRGRTVLFTVLGRHYTLEALTYGLVLAGMLGAMLLWFGCYSRVLTSDKFICLFGRLIPSLSLLLVMILRMIPAFQRKARQLVDARQCIGRGIGEQASFRERLNVSGALLSALTDWALEGSIVTADSMRARGYGTARRTSFRIYRLRWTDLAMGALIVGLSVFVIASGGLSADFIPTMEIDRVGWGLAAYAALLSLPLLLDGEEELRWRISRSRI